MVSVGTAGTLFNILRFAVNDGPGLRTTVFLKGCPLSCWWCHNPESQAAQPELILRAERCIGCGRCREVCELIAAAVGDATITTIPSGLPKPESCNACGRCAEACPSGAREIAGYQLTAAELLARVSRDIVFYDQSGGGVTFSGGEPVCQPGFLLECLRLCRSRGIRTAVDTSGHAPWEVLAAVAQEADMLLYDLKAMDTLRHKVCTGVGNELILCNLAELSRRHDQIIVRVPVIPGINDDADNAEEAATFLRRETRVTRVALLSYHAIGQAKYGRLGREYQLPELTPPEPEHLAALARIYERAGLTVLDVPQRQPGPNHTQSD